MTHSKQIKNVLISVFDKNGLEDVVQKLNQRKINIFSTGGTEKFIKGLNIPVNKVEEVTGFPSILGGRVKTLHPNIFGGILSRRNNESDKREVENYKITEFDAVIVDLYPFEQTVSDGGTHNEIIEKIDIGGISLIRAAAKNYNDVLVISSKNQYKKITDLLEIDSEINNTLELRKDFAAEAFNISSHYDTAIFKQLSKEKIVFKESKTNHKELRYGENPHQKGVFFGEIDKMFEQKKRMV